MRGRTLRISTLLLLAAIAPRARAVELGAEAGVTDLAQSGSYSWELEYRERFAALAGVSFAYLNEGHLPDHHRDGAALQLWGDTPPWRDRVRLFLGIGPYLYCDTQPEDSAPRFRDDHGVGAIATASFTWYITSSWFTRMSLNEIRAPGDIDSTTLVLGFGYREDPAFEPHEAGEPAVGDGALSNGPNEFGAFIGQTVLNSLSSPKSSSFGLEYRRRIDLHVELSGAWLSEADALDGGRHSGVLGEVWLVQPLLRDELSVGIGAGPYAALQAYRTADGRSGPGLAGVGSMTASWRLARSLVARFEWHRGFTHDDQDRDMVTLGLAWVFGR